MGPALLELLERHEPVVASLPAVTRHGDLWAGNVLLDHGRLSGVIDWDGWAAAAVPGTDLVHMVALDRAVATRASFAEVLVQRPWEAAILQEAAGRYWDGLGITPLEARARHRGGGMVGRQDGPQRRHEPGRGE